MSALSILDAGLVLLVLAVAVWTIAARETFPAIAGFVSYGLLLAIVWVRLSSVDVALTEAAIGGGATGVLLLGAAGRLVDPATKRASRHGPRVLAAALCLAITAALAFVVLTLPDPAPTLAPEAVAGLSATGVGNPITAVLVAYRGIDTLLEKIVLLLAVIGVWCLTPDASWGVRPALWGTVRQDKAHPDEAIVLLARLLAPIGVVVGVYLVWVGADDPGGAFQGGTILAAMWLLAIMAGLRPAPAATSRRLRRALVAGPAVFLAVAFAGFALSGDFLSYPPAYAKWLIKLIEAALTLSIAAMVGVLVLGPAARKR